MLPLSLSLAALAGSKPAFKMAAVGPKLNNPCTDVSTPQSKQPWCNAKLPINERIKDMLSRMTLNEKIDALDTSESSIDSLGLVAYNWCEPWRIGQKPGLRSMLLRARG